MTEATAYDWSMVNGASVHSAQGCRGSADWLHCASRQISECWSGHSQAAICSTRRARGCWSSSPCGSHGSCSRQGTAAVHTKPRSPYVWWHSARLHQHFMRYFAIRSGSGSGRGRACEMSDDHSLSTSFGSFGGRKTTMPAGTKGTHGY